MQLNSFSFLLFFGGVFILFWQIAKRYQWIWLLLASYYFYASAKPAYLGLIVVTTVINFYGALALNRFPDHKKRYLLLTLFFNLSTLFIFKYFNFFSLTLRQVGHISLPQFKLFVPIGISFYTLQVTGYLLDVYNGTIKPEKHLGIFAVYVCFFPQLSAGPINRAKTLLPQLKKPLVFDYDQVASGAKLFTFGLFKKMVIADNLGSIVDQVFTALPEYKGFSLILTIIFFTWQIYMDFSGYTDMARGVSAMVGIDLMENFNLPYLATSVRDFWRRWHISLSSWLRDYLYIPLGGNRYGLTRTILNTLIVFAVSGLWHGAAWHFVVWGILHGAWISLERIAYRLLPKNMHIPRMFKIIYTYCVISIFWVFFRAETLANALYILRQAFVGVKNFISPSYLLASVSHLFVFDTAEIVIVFSLLGISIATEIIRNKLSLSRFLDKQPVFLRFAIYTLLVFMILQLRTALTKEFIYIQY